MMPARPPEPPETLIELELNPTATVNNDLGFTDSTNETTAAGTAASSRMISTTAREHRPAVVASESMSLLSANVAASGDNSPPSNGGTGSGAPASQEAGRKSGGTGSGGNSGGIIAPSVLSRVEPEYPEAARQSGQSGKVVVKVQILENGRAGSVSVQRSSGFSALDAAAVAAVSQWRFVPARLRDSGQAIVSYSAVPIRFDLQ